MKKFLIVSVLVIVSVFLFSRCYMLNRFIYTDAELEEHYRDLTVKPNYKDCQFLQRQMHYAILSKSDTLPLLVMIHGAPGAWYGYMNLTDDSTLQKHFKIVAIDRLGYGKSGYGQEELSVQMQALAVKSIIDKENTQHKKVYLLGRSYGAPIAAWLAINYPQNVEKLMMVSPVIDPDKEKFYWFSDIGNSSLVQWALPDLLNVATKEKYSHQKEMKLMVSQWKKLYVPTYVITGDDDMVADTANYTFAKKNILNCPAVFMKLKHTGHLVTREQPEIVKQLLLDNSCCQQISEIIDKDLPSEISYHGFNPAIGKTLTAGKISSTSQENSPAESHKQ